MSVLRAVRMRSAAPQAGACRRLERSLTSGFGEAAQQMGRAGPCQHYTMRTSAQRGRLCRSAAVPAPRADADRGEGEGRASVYMYTYRRGWG